MQTFWDDERAFRLRITKAAQFLRLPPSQDIVLHPRPWTEADQPYLLYTPRGGYLTSKRLDEAGVPYQDGPGGRLYHPLVVAEHILRELSDASRSSRSTERPRLDGCLEAILESARPTGAWGRGSSPGRMTSKVVSAPVQGLVISALLRITRGKPAARIEAVIDRAVRRMIEPEEEGGALSRTEAGPFLEEAPGSPLRLILGGCCTALFGLYDAADALGHEAACRTAHDVETTIERLAGRFVAPAGWSYYALTAYGRPYLASLHYHRMMIAKARLIGTRTGRGELLRVAGIWDRAMASSWRRLLAATAKSAQVVWMRDVRRLPLQVCP